MPTQPELCVTWINPLVEGLAKLDHFNEIRQIASIPRVKLTPLSGHISRDQIAEALKRRADVQIWSGHGEPGGLCIPPVYPGERYETIKPKWLALQAHCGLPKVVVLAVCSSALLDIHLRGMCEEVSRAGVNVIGFPHAANDISVVRFNVEFVRALADGARLGDAFELARDEMTHQDTAQGTFLVPGLTNGYRDIADRLENFATEIVDVKSTLSDLQTDMRRIMEKMELDPPKPRRRKTPTQPSAC